MTGSVRPLIVLALVLAEVGMWQWRVILTGRGRRSLPTLLGILGAVLQITAVAQVVTNLADPLTVTAYATGVGGGVLFGVWLADRFTANPVRVNVVTTDAALDHALRGRNWPVIAYAGISGDATVQVLQILAPAHGRDALLRDVEELAPDAPRTVETIERLVLAPSAQRRVTTAP